MPTVPWTGPREVVIFRLQVAFVQCCVDHPMAGQSLSGWPMGSPCAWHTLALTWHLALVVGITRPHMRRGACPMARLKDQCSHEVSGAGGGTGLGHLPPGSSASLGGICRSLKGGIDSCPVSLRAHDLKPWHRIISIFLCLWMEMTAS